MARHRYRWRQPPRRKYPTETAASVMQLMRSLADRGVAILVATLDEAFLGTADTAAMMDEGRLTPMAVPSVPP